MVKRIALGLALACAVARTLAQAPEGDIPPAVEQAPGGTRAAAPPESAAPAEPPAPTQPPAQAPAAPTISATGSSAPEEERRRATLSDFERKVQVEEAGKKAEQAVEAGRAGQEEEETEQLLRQSAAEERRRAAAERRAESRRQTIARERSCVIKPVMTDAEIAHCKWVWSFPPPS